MRVARVRDPHQADLMAGFAVHEVLHDVRGFGRMADCARRAEWRPEPMRAPEAATVAVLGNGTMGRAVARGCAALGFDVRIACRSIPEEPMEGVTYCAGDAGIAEAAEGAVFVIKSSK